MNFGGLLHAFVGFFASILMAVGLQAPMQATFGVSASSSQPLETQTMPVSNSNANLDDNEPFTASPASGQAPLDVLFTMSLPRIGTYGVDFGDGTQKPDVSDSCSMSPDSVTTHNCEAFHTYTSAGTYKARLLQRSTVEGADTALAMVTVTVTGTSTNSSGAYRTYSDQSLGVQVAFPASWNLKTDCGGVAQSVAGKGAGICITSPDFTRVFDASTTVTGAQFSMNPPGEINDPLLIDPNEYRSWHRNLTTDSTSVISDKEISIGGEVGFLTQYSIDTCGDDPYCPPTPNVLQYTIETVHDGYLYNVDFVYQQFTTEDKAALDAFIAGFKFLKPTPTDPQAALDPNSFVVSVNQPIVYGTAQQVNTLKVDLYRPSTISSGNNELVTSVITPVLNGKWSASLTSIGGGKSFAPGSYIINIVRWDGPLTYPNQLFEAPLTIK